MPTNCLALQKRPLLTGATVFPEIATIEPNSVDLCDRTGMLTLLDLNTLEITRSVDVSERISRAIPVNNNLRSLVTPMVDSPWCAVATSVH